MDIHDPSSCREERAEAELEKRRQSPLLIASSYPVLWLMLAPFLGSVEVSHLLNCC